MSKTNVLKRLVIWNPNDGRPCQQKRVEPELLNSFCESRRLEGGTIIYPREETL